MREILFRGKRLDNGEWVYGSLVTTNRWVKSHTKYWIVVSSFGNGGWFYVERKYPVIPSTVGQFTGLKDKNDNKIFEGDILYDSEDYYLIYFDEYTGMYMVRCYYILDDEYSTKSTFEEPISAFNSDEFEIKGNIHDNKELLD